MSIKLLLDKAHVPGIRGFEVYRREVKPANSGWIFLSKSSILNDQII
jgi:hypothetical protein